MLKNIFLLCLAFISSPGARFSRSNWDGLWFPHDPNDVDNNPIATIHAKDLDDPLHGIKMGIPNPECDDGETNLKLDWFLNPDNYTCLERRQKYFPSSYIHPVHTIEHVPKFYHAAHSCMNESISYSQNIPTFGTHRPLWAVYGEYKFLPKQRWLHNLEHGGVVMLYHPCAEANEVNLLKDIIRNCLFKHIITPYNMLEPKRPLALVTWGHRLEMSKVSKDLVIKFIRDHALQGPEDTFRDGQYTLGLHQKAKIVSDERDSKLCPDGIDNSITMK